MNLNYRFGHHADDESVENILNQLEKQNLVQSWTRILNNPKPALLVIDMQNDFISGKGRKTLLYIV